MGTAGHIDHGKSSLVRALTGTDPDRLPEEKARGMTIDLGFAHARVDDWEIEFVDVPGHEGFIRNMLAGATGVDAALLVVAADDSVMPQTREHAELLALLGVERVIVALTKIDLVDEGWAEQVEAEARELLAGLGIEPAAVVRTSVTTGVGLDELRGALVALGEGARSVSHQQGQGARGVSHQRQGEGEGEAPAEPRGEGARGVSDQRAEGARRISHPRGARADSPCYTPPADSRCHNSGRSDPERPPAGRRCHTEVRDDSRTSIADARTSRGGGEWLHLPIDRAFSVAGRGTVVTGTVLHGQVQRDDELELWPSGRRVRARDLQSHNQARDAAAGRMRLAINLAGVPLDEVSRGCTLATPGFLQPSRCLDVRLLAFRPPGRSEKRRTHVRLHIGTAEVMAELRWPPRVGVGGEPSGATASAAISPHATRPAATSPQATSHGATGHAAEPGTAAPAHEAARYTPVHKAEPCASAPKAEPWAPGPGACWAQIIPEQPIVAEWGQRFILRDVGATRTLGGGVIVRPVGQAWTARRPAQAGLLDVLERGEAGERVAAELELAGWEAIAPERLAARVGLRDAAEARCLCESLSREGKLATLGPATSPTYLATKLLNETAVRLNERLAALLRENPRLPGVARSAWASWMPAACPAGLRGALAEWLIERGCVSLSGGHVLPRGSAAALSATDEALFAALLGEFEAGGLTPPALDALRCRTAANARRLGELVQLAAARGRLARLAEGIWIHEAAWRAAVERVVAALRERGSLTMAEIRDALRSSRKFVVPLMEALDKAGLTRRVGDVRRLGPKADAAGAEMRGAASEPLAPSEGS